MPSEAFAVLRNHSRSLLWTRAPEQLALGLTIGMLIGLMPKTNLLAFALCLLLFTVRCNKSLGLASAIVFSFVAQWTDAFAHRLGSMALDFEPMQACYASAFNLPLGPWIGFDNTVVTGSLLLGLYLAYPVYWISRLLFTSIGHTLAEAAE